MRLGLVLLADQQVYGSGFGIFLLSQAAQKKLRTSICLVSEQINH
jgi:hypothetical protein